MDGAQREGLQTALTSLRTHYKDNGGPSHASIADSTGLSEATVQRYLGTAQLKVPNYNSIVSIATVIGMNTADLTLGQDVVDILPKEELADLVLELRKMNIDELARNDAQWRERLDAEKAAHSDDIQHLTEAHVKERQRSDEAHDAQIERIQRMHAEQLKEVRESYVAQMEQMRTANSALVAQMQDSSSKHDAQRLEAAQQQAEHIQQTSKEQYAMLQQFAKTQKDADEKSKAYLKRQIRTWKVIAFLFATALILLLAVDLANPNRGWIRFIGSKLFSMRAAA